MPPTGPDRSRPWQPLLRGARATRATDAVEGIARALLPSTATAAPPSLAGGSIGLALLYGYLALAKDRDRWLGAMLDHLDSATEGFNQQPAFASLYGGFPALAWIWRHFGSRLVAFRHDLDEDVWPGLTHVLEPERWRGPIDLVHGLVGLGVCALEALPTPEAAEVLEHVIHRLDDAATRTDDHVFWRTSPSHLPASERTRYPDGRYNLGVAHGTPGIIALLGRAVEVGVAASRAGDLLDGAVPWLMAQALPSGRSTFPAILDAEGIADAPARLAWCYGDAGIATTLFATACRVGRPAWRQQAVTIALKAARRPQGTAGVRDAGLCHGAAGLGHMFNRLYQATRHPELGDAARSWFDQALAYQDSPDGHAGAGVGGFWALDVGEDGETERIADPGFLNGAAGVALALLAATTETEPGWDRLLLL